MPTWYVQLGKVCVKLNNNVKQMRERHKLSQEDLAQKALVGRSTISNIETGTYVPNIYTVLRIAKALGYKVEDLFSLDDAPQ